MTAGSVAVREADLDAVMRLSRAIGAVLAEASAALNTEVTQQQLRALVVVSSRSSVNVGGLASALGIHLSNASRLGDRLVQAGLLQRGEHGGDRRNLSLTLTPEGTRLVDRLMARRRRTLRTLLAQLSPQHQAELAVAATRLADLAGEPTAGPSEADDRTTTNPEGRNVHE